MSLLSYFYGRKMHVTVVEQRGDKVRLSFWRIVI
jgi:hypothetical protein